MQASPPRYQIVLRRDSRRWPWVLLLGVAWLASLAVAWRWAEFRAAPALADATTRMHRAEGLLADQRARLQQLSQRETTLAVSDKISRDANGDLQGTLAERDEEISALRADVAFYERLVGPTQQRKGLNVFSSEFAPGAGAAWHYQIVLTQNLNRGAISQGRMRFVLEGVRAGKLATVDWAELNQRPGMQGQGFSFRYFQSLEGQVMLPRDFTPQRVRVLLDGEDVAVEQAFDWKNTNS
ncbi:MAG: hypothetical protein EOP92_06635 [Lysobacteraceae bacterium]|nr:MAG: hypothetical protein EOP92_06635 [Xanthomonadaceae bacterium]